MYSEEFLPNLRGVSSSFRVSVLTDEEVRRLTQARQDFGAIRSVIGRTTETIAVGLAPAVTSLFGYINSLLNVVRYLSENFRGAFVVMSYGTVIVLSLIAVFATWGIAIFTVQLSIRTLTLTTTYWNAAMAWSNKTVAVSILRVRLWAISITGSTIAVKASVVATKAATVAQWLWNVALNANPIGLVVLAVAALVAGIIVMIKYKEEVIRFFKGWGQATLLLLGPLGLVFDSRYQYL